jgi:hypothetical protein
MKNLLRFSLGLMVILASAPLLGAAETNALSPRIHSLEVQIRSGANMKEMRSHLYLLITRRHPESPGASEGRVQLLQTKGYGYAPGDKWGPGEEKTFGPLVSVERFSKEDLGGLALVNAMDAAEASEFEVDWIKVFAIDQAGKKWLLAKYIHHHWLRSKPDADELPVLSIPTVQWGEQPPGQ